jgi:maltooligosyltrehalose trehalohydrolase
MMYNDKPVGAQFESANECAFRVWAPERTSVALVVMESKEVFHKMSQEDFGYWSTSVSDLAPGTPYLFQLDGNKKLPDPASRWQPHGVHGPSALVTAHFPWSDESWKGISMGDMIIYELHVGTFSAAGNFDGIISRLPYLKELGINTIELMPLGQFPGNRNWGYDGVYSFAVHHDYGGAIGLKKLVNEAHSHDIAVMLDVVYNHQGPEGNYLSEYGPYFTDKYKTGWGKAINFDDAWCDGVRNFYWQNALMWLDEFHLDGLRLDAVHAIWDFSAKPFIQELTRQVRLLESKLGRKKVLIAEFDLNNPRYINPREKGGYGLDGQWIDEFHHALHAVVTGEVDGYYEDFGTLSHLVKSFKNSYVYTGEYSKHRKKRFGVDPSQNSYDQFVVFAQNHDQIGNRMLGDRLTSTLSFEALKLVAATVLLSPQVPLLFMGEEYGEQNPFQYFISHTDKELVKMVREGRRKEFSYFNWQGEVPDPQDEKTFLQCKLSWDVSIGQRSVLLSFYQHLISFRQLRVAMQGRQKENVRVFEVPQKKVIGLERSYQSDTILIFLNFEKQRTEFKNPVQKTLTMILDSALFPAIENNAGTTLSPYHVVEMQPESVLIFEM